jgi:hypothetical protein
MRGLLGLTHNVKACLTAAEEEAGIGLNRQSPPLVLSVFDLASGC